MKQEMTVKELLPLFHNKVLNKTFYHGIRALKNPLDFWIYQEIIFETRPDVIIEIGNFHGGSLLALAHVLDNLNCGRLIGIDINQTNIDTRCRNHQRITLFEGDAVSLFDKVKENISASESVMIIEDSSHSYEGTLSILERYSPLVTAGTYFIVEDGICNNGIDAVGCDPYSAIQTFLKGNNSFMADERREEFVLTYNPSGFLKKLS